MVIDENYKDSVGKPVDDEKDVEETYKEYAEKVESEQNDENVNNKVMLKNGEIWRRL